MCAAEHLPAVGDVCARVRVRVCVEGVGGGGGGGSAAAPQPGLGGGGGGGVWKRCVCVCVWEGGGGLRMSREGSVSLSPPLSLFGRDVGGGSVSRGVGITPRAQIAASLGDYARL